MFFIYCLIYISFYPYGYAQQVCTWGNHTGGPNYAAATFYSSFLAVDHDIPCAGKINSWSFSYDPATAPLCHSLVFQVYRPFSGSYQLVGENEYQPVCPNIQDIVMLPVPEEFMIPVQAGDLIGWTDTGSGAGSTQRILEYSSGLPGSNLIDTVRILDTSCRDAHSVCDWNQYAAEFGRKYSLQATVENGDVPFIDNLDSFTTVAEHQPPGIKIYRVIGSNDRNYNDVVHANFTYSLISGGSGEFDIDPETGVVYTLREMDHETSASIILTIDVAQGPLVNQSKLTVNIRDINEPHTLHPLPDVGLDSATTYVDTLVYGSLDVVDLDDPGSWPGKTFLLVNIDPVADIFYVAGDEIRCRENLTDWQGPTVVDIYISATDYFYTTVPEKMTITIDNIWQPPTIDNLPNAVTLWETIPHQSIYNVNADRDSRAYLEEFNIVSVYPAQVAPPNSNPFSIDNSGTVRYVGSPDFDFMTVNRYEIEIQVYDGKFLSVAENLTVDITWVNHAPKFDETMYASSVSELSPKGTMLPDVFLKVTDRDIPLGDWVDYTLSGTGSHLFRVSNITNTVFVNGELLCDPQQPTQVYILTVTVSDSFGAIDTGGRLTVTVTDINNHVPVFGDNYYEGSVSETSLGEASVLQIDTTDDDAGENARMSFVVLEEDARIYFEVVPFCTNICNRQLQMKQPISHVDYHNITFTLVVFDHGIPSLNSSTTVYVEVVDENNHPPEFVQEYYNLETRTDLQQLSEVAAVEIYDPDTDINSNVSFLLLIPTKGYLIDESTGVIKNRYNMEAYQTHIFYVYARDWSTPELLSNPSIVRMDTYTPQHHLVDIHMEIPLTEFIGIKEEFLTKLNQHISPWYAKEEKKLLDPNKSILTIYALEEKPPESLDDLDHTKTFVDRNSLLARLRVNLPGKPQEWLRDEEFAEYQVFKVLPTYPVWFIDTIAGIVTLTLLCLLFLLVWVAICYAIFRGCKKSKAKVAPARYPPVEEYALNYGDYAHVHYSQNSVSPVKKKGVLTSPLMPVTTTKKNKKDKGGKPSSQQPDNVAEGAAEETYTSELPPVESTTGRSDFPNKPLPPSGQTRIL